MTLQEAARILDVPENADKVTIKRSYRRLMHRVHPDVLRDREPSYGYTAWDINAAYEYLMETLNWERYSGDSEASQRNRKDPANSGPTPPSSRKWHAPENVHAFTARDIFLGSIRIAHGRFYRTEEEEFPMFLRSIYYCSREILSVFSDEVIQKYQGEAAYLLAQQFLDRQHLLSRYEVTEGNEAVTWYFPAMLETEGVRCYARAGTVLFPSSVRKHRLYLKNREGQELGYVSFADDQLYYALVPLFEQRAVEIKARVAGSVLGHNQVRAVKVRTLDLWVRMPEQKWQQVEVSLTMKIEALLRHCREEDLKK